MPTLLSIALRNILRNRRRTLITLAALIVGVGVMVSIRGLLNGLQRALVTNTTQGQTGALQVHKKGYFANVLTSPLNLDLPQNETLEKIQAVPGVTHVAPRIQFAGMLSVGDQTVFAAFFAVDPKRELLVCPLRIDVLTAGSHFVGQDHPDGAVFTVELMRAIESVKQQEAAVLAPDRDGVLSGENVHLDGSMALSLPGERKIGLVPLDLAQRLLKMPDRATEFAVSVDPIESAPHVAELVRSALGEGYEVHTWAEVAMFVKQAMDRQNFMVSLTSSCFMALMLLGVANTMLMSVIERTREIGTMMALGVKRRRILQLFILESFCLGAVGGTLGALVGLLVVSYFGIRGITFIAPGSSAPFTLVPYIASEYLISITAIAMAGAGLFALYPAWRASRLNPVDALAGR